VTSASNGFAVREWAGTIEMAVVGPWSDEAASAFECENVDRLILNTTLGFDEPSLDFLTGLPVRELDIRDSRVNSEGLEPLYSLSETLVKVDLGISARAIVDLARLPRLTNLIATWRQVRASINHAVELESLFLDSYEEPDLTPLAMLRSLSSLGMTGRPRISSLLGLSTPTSMQHLSISVASKLTDLTELRTMRNLVTLQFEGCRRISSIADIEACVGVQFLNVGECGELPTIAPIRMLTSLDSLYLYGDTKVLDGDLTPILALPRLEDFRMMNRRHYKPSVSEIEERILARNAK
jgi:hypothetical protein